MSGFYLHYEGRSGFLQNLAEGDIVTMMNPGDEHLADGLYKGVLTKVVKVEGSVEGRDLFLFVEGKKSKTPIGCFPERVAKGQAPRQMELF